MSDSSRIMPSGLKLAVRVQKTEDGRLQPAVYVVGGAQIYLGNRFSVSERPEAIEEAEAWIRENRLVIGKRH